MLMRLLAEEIAAEPGQRSLDKAFGFRERGGTSPAYASRLARRNALLVGLWRSQPQWADLSAVEASEAMDRAARAYRARRWNSDRKRSTPPASEPAATFWRVMVDGGKIPQAETIRDIFLGVST